MTMTDPIADMLTRVRNANSAHKDDVSMPFSNLKSHIAEILQAEGYIASWAVEDAEVGKTLTIQLKYGPNRERSIAGLRRVSKPGPARLRQEHQPSEGARRPRHRDHFHVVRPADRQAGG
jgi:small subunit ribosomal protein S8